MLYEYQNPPNVQTDVLVGIWDLGLLAYFLAPSPGVLETLAQGLGRQTVPPSAARPKSLSGSICLLRAFNMPLSLASA